MAIKVRDYEVRLTKNKEERRQVRALRYAVFCEEEGASATEEQKNLREEYDSFDRFAEYMAVFHNGNVVGCYRIIDREAAEKMGSFYTECEFNISKIKKVRGNIAEMSRACVDVRYRDNALVMRLLWAGLSEYVLRRKVRVLFGVASWVGQKPGLSAHAISYLYYNRLAPSRLRATVVDNFHESVNPALARMNIMPKEFVDEDEAFRQMPPLVKGYLRIGADFGKGVFVDKNFNTYDVFVTLQTKNINATYQKHFLGRENALDDLDVDIDDGAVKTIGKIVLFPVTGPLKVLGSFVKFFLREDAEDAEYVEDSVKDNDADVE